MNNVCQKAKSLWEREGWKSVFVCVCVLCCILSEVLRKREKRIKREFKKNTLKIIKKIYDICWRPEREKENSEGEAEDEKKGP